MDDKFNLHLPHPAAEEADKPQFEEVSAFESLTDLYELPSIKFEYGYHSPETIKHQADESVEEYIARYAKIVVAHAQRDLRLYPNDNFTLNGLKKTYEELLFSGKFEKELQSLLEFLLKLTDFTQVQSLRSIRNSKSSIFGEAGYAIDYPPVHKINDDFFSGTNKTNGISTDRQLLYEAYHDSPLMDTRSYSNVLFSIPDTNNSLAREYIKDKLDNKHLLVLGGGSSLTDLLTTEDDLKPASVTNVDPFIKQEDQSRNKKSIYRSVCSEAENPNLLNELKNGDTSQYDEVWSLYSVPFYTKSSEGMKLLVKNVSGLMAPGAVWRIYPYGFPVFGNETQDESDERINAFQEAILDLLDSGDFDVRIVKHREELGHRTMIITRKREVLQSAPDSEL